MSIALLRQQLSAVIDGGRPESPGFPTGLEALDALLPGGGFPRGRLTEVASALGHGRTTFLRQCVTHALARGSWVAVIDATRTLAARDWAAVHTEVDGLWMVRPKDPARGAWCADVLLRSGAFGLVVLDGAPPLARATGVRLTALARESDAAFVVATDAPSGAAIGGALRLRVTTRAAPPPRPVVHRIGERLAARTPAAPPMGRQWMITIDKGGPMGARVELRCDDDDNRARGVCADPPIPDRRGVARRTQRRR